MFAGNCPHGSSVETQVSKSKSLFPHSSAAVRGIRKEVSAASGSRSDVDIAIAGAKKPRYNDLNKPVTAASIELYMHEAVPH